MVAKGMHDWEIIASRDPFFGVICSEDYRAGRIDAEARTRFYASGERNIAHVLSLFDADLGARPGQGRALDIGCGLGRLSYAMAKVMPAVVGYDVSETMIRLAQENAPPNLDLTTRLPDGPFEWINSLIVFQHIPPAEGLALLDACLERSAPRAFISIQMTGWRTGAQPARNWRARFRRWRNVRIHRQSGQAVDPLIAMHEYNFSDVLKCVMSRGFERVVLRHTAHGDHHGAWIIGRRG